MTSESSSPSPEKFSVETVALRIVDTALKYDQRFAVTLKTCKSLIESEWSAFMAFANRANRLSELCFTTDFYGTPIHRYFAKNGLIETNSSADGFPSREIGDIERRVERDFWLVDRLKKLALDYERTQDRSKDASPALIDMFVHEAVYSLVRAIERHS